MSATFDTSMFAQYFAMNIAGELVDPPIVNVSGICYDVKEFYAEDFPKLGLHSPKVCLIYNSLTLPTLCT